MGKITEELLKLKETKAALKNILNQYGLVVSDQTKFTDYPLLFKRILNHTRVRNIASNISNIGKTNSNLYNSQFIDLGITLKAGYTVEITYKLLNNVKGYICGDNDNKLKAEFTNDPITRRITASKDASESLYIFGYNAGNTISKDQCPAAIYAINIFDNTNKQIFNGIPFEEDGIYSILNTLDRSIYLNKGTGEDFYEYKTDIKELNKFYTYNEIIKG